jgi:transcriptional regulator with XRE-family HTH domain
MDVTTTNGTPQSGVFLRAARDAAGLTQADLAVAAGVSINTVRLLERGCIRPERSRAAERVLAVLRDEAA